MKDAAGWKKKGLLCICLFLESAGQNGGWQMRRSASWEKPEGAPDLIARKVVDWSLFRYGFYIPLEFLPDFQEANGGCCLDKGESKKIILLWERSYFDAFLRSQDRPEKSYDLNIRYDHNEELKALLQKEFSHSFEYLEKHGPHTHVPPEIAEFIEFHKTGIPFVYRIRLVSLGKEFGDMALFSSAL